MSRLRTIERHFVKVQQIDFPYGVRLRGPFETRSEAWANYEQLRDKKVYPDCNMTLVCKSVPLAQAHSKEN